MAVTRGAVKLSSVFPTAQNEPVEHLPDNLGGFTLKYKSKLMPQAFYDLFWRTCGRCKLQHLPPESHPAATLLNHLRTHRSPVTLAASPSSQRRLQQLKKVAHPTTCAQAKFPHLMFMTKSINDTFLSYRYPCSVPTQLVDITYSVHSSA